MFKAVLTNRTKNRQQRVDETAAGTKMTVLKVPTLGNTTQEHPIIPAIL
jgi:hypothetical protein